MSRDRWLKPDDAHRIAVRFAQRHSGAWAKVLNAVPQEAFHVGMIRGFPVAFAVCALFPMLAIPLVPADPE
ncbi:hypothetical protein K0U83_03785 [bacterium]|nr:hypothetical protein [bacterium]